jgi:glycosyltransferase involved in cell wall biosynthesis
VRALFYHPGGRWCGEARAFAAAARGLTAGGWHAALATAAGSPAARAADRAGAGVVALDAADSFVGAVATLARAVRGHSAEVVFAHGERGQAVAAGAAWRAGRGAVVRRVPSGPPQAAGGSVARAAARTATTAYLCTWADQVDCLPARGRAAAVVADLGVAVPPDEAAPAPGPQRLVCAFEPTAQLRAATVLRAAALLAPRHPDLRVVLAGPGAGDEGLRMHAAALGIHHLLRAHDPGRDADGPSDAAAQADLARATIAWVVAEGDDGAFGALDAMAAGVPVLAERGTTAARYVADAITGLHLAPGDVPGTAAVLAQLLAGHDARRAMGQAGRARVARTYTEAAMLDGFARAAASV